MKDKELKELQKSLNQFRDEICGIKKYPRSSNRDSKAKTGKYWVYNNNDIVIGKVCLTCKRNEELMQQHYGKPIDDWYVTNRRNHDKCDICGE